MLFLKVYNNILSIVKCELMIMSAACWPMKMFDMIVDTISNNEIKKIFCNGMWLCE